MGVNMSRVWKRQKKGEKCLCVKTEWKESWQCLGVFNKLRICSNSFNKRANPRHSKTDREGKKEREREQVEEFYCLLATFNGISYIFLEIITTHTALLRTSLLFPALPCDSLFIFSWRFFLYLSLSLWSSVFLTLLLNMLSSLTRRIFLIPTPLPLNLSQIEFLWTPSESIWTYSVWIIQRVTLPSGDVRPTNIQTHLPPINSHFPKSYCTFLGKNNTNLWVCLCVCKQRMSLWGNQEQHRLKGKLLCHHQHFEIKRIKIRCNKLGLC